MKILVATPTPPDTQPTNSVPLVVYAQLRGLAARHEVTLVTADDAPEPESDAISRLRHLGVDVHIARPQPDERRRRWERRRRLARLWLCGRYPFRTVWYWEPELQRLIDRLLSERHFDIVTAEDNAMGVYRYGAAQPTVLTEMEVRRPRPIDWRAILRHRRRATVFNEIDWQRWRWYQPHVWRRFDCVQVFTARDVEAIQRIDPSLAGRVRVNPFGIEMPPAADPRSEQDDSLVFVGGFSHWPNVDAALWLAQSIMPQLRARRSGVRLVLVGSYPPPEIQALASEDVIVTGYVPSVESFLERAAVVLAPVRVGGGMRMKVLQAMALGKAVITTPLGAEGLTLAGERPPLVMADADEGIVEAAAGLLAGREQREALGRAARAFVDRHFSVQAYARRLEAIYGEVIETHRQVERRRGSRARVWSG
ncbi:MAG: glycosyltransferase family 4 protein [Anaerolineae bacterium]